VTWQWHRLEVCHGFQQPGFLDNYRPLSSPVSIFLTVSTPLNLCKGLKHSATRIGYHYFHCCSPLLMLCMSTVILICPDNHIFFVTWISVSWFWIRIKSLNTYIRWQYSSVWFRSARFESRFALGIFIDDNVMLLLNKFTFIAQFFQRSVRMVIKPIVPTALNFLAIVHWNLHHVQIMIIFYCSCAEKTLFWFDPAYPRPNSASTDAWKFSLGSQKYLFPVQCIQVCKCVRSKTV
jgi:hypothetical protein